MALKGRPPHARTWRRAWRTFFAAGTAFGLLLGAVTGGMLGPTEQELGSAPRSGTLDYSSPARPFTPLDAGFVSRALGLFTDPAAGGKAAGEIKPFTVASRPPRARVVVEHPPTNDDVQDAYVVPSIPFRARSTTAGASQQAGEPRDCALTGGTIWYRYRTVEPGSLVASTIGSEGLTSLGVFTGSRITDLERVACDDDHQGNAQVAFAAAANTAYFFQVASPASGGDVVFNLEMAGTIRRSSVATDGTEGDDISGWAKISADGRYIAFESWASTLVPDDTNGTKDVFVYDRITSETTRVSVSSSGAEGNRRSGDGGGLTNMYGGPAISADGRFVAFASWADNLVEGDTNGWQDVFVHDRRTGETTRVSVASDGTEGQAYARVWVRAGLDSCSQIDGRTPRDPITRDHCPLALGVAISADGRHVAFGTTLQGLDPRDTDAGVTFDPNGSATDVYLHDRATGRTELISVSIDGNDGDSGTYAGTISADGRFVAMSSFASNLVHGDTNGGFDVFVYDATTRTTRRVSETTGGADADGSSMYPSISADGRYVAFESDASNLVPEDTNGLPDVFVTDLGSGTIERVSLDTSGRQAECSRGASGIIEGCAGYPSISADGRFVAFHSIAGNLGPRGLSPMEDTGGWQVYLRDRLLGETSPISVTPRGDQANDLSMFPSISADGRHIAFSSWASNLVEGDRNAFPADAYYVGDYFYGLDVFVHSHPVLR